MEGTAVRPDYTPVDEERKAVAIAAQQKPPDLAIGRFNMKSVETGDSVHFRVVGVNGPMSFVREIFGDRA